MLGEPVEVWKLVATSATLLIGLIGTLFVSRKGGKLTIWGKVLAGLLVVSFSAAVSTQWLSFQENRENAKQSRQTIEKLTSELEAARLQQDRLMTRFNPFELQLGFTGTLPTDLTVFARLRDKWLELALENYRDTRQVVHGDGGDFYIGGRLITLARGDEGYPVPEKHGAAAVFLERLNIHLKIFQTPLPKKILKDSAEFAARKAGFEAYFPGPMHIADAPGSRALHLSLTNDRTALSDTVRVAAINIEVQPFGGNKINSVRDLLGAQLVVEISGYVPAKASTDVRETIESAWNRIRLRQLTLFTGRRNLLLTSANGLTSVINDRGNTLHVFHLTDEISDFLPEL